MVDGFGWKPVLRADQCGSAKEVLCLRPWSQDGWPSFRYPRVQGSWDFLYMLHFTHKGMGFDHWVFEPSFPSFLSPYHPSLRYVPCLKTTLRPWDRMPYWGIFRFGGSLWIFAEGHISVRMRFTDHEGVACLSLFARSRFILFDVVVIPGWGYVECLDPHVIISVRYTSGLLCIPMVLFSGHQGRSVRRSEPLLSLTFRVIIITSQFRRSKPSSVFRSTFRVPSSVSASRVVIAPQLRCSEPSSLLLSVSAFRAIIGFQIDIQSPLLGFGVQSRYHFLASVFRAIITTFSVSTFRAVIGFQIDVQSRVLEPSSVFRSTFRVAFSVSAFRVVITSQLRCSEPSSLLLLVSAFRAIIGFQIDVQSRVLGFGVQSRYHFLASVFRAIITTSLSFGVQSRHRFSDRRSESRSRFRRSESLSLLNFGVQSHHHYFSQFRRSKPSSVFRSTFRVVFSVSAFRVVITSQLRCSEPSSLLLSVSAFRAIIDFQIDIQSHILGFGVQSRYHFSV
ncbi:hypothetical protein CK203_105098 [Vitis vinifera]|uniref:Uncharacterized protein n=1 Tax=Vitis vinifera TaxID=29760 RepID=A0A438CNQ4_VITVI|nr:hypothetical protein CK203_105098 [Vitis vinifera]